MPEQQPKNPEVNQSLSLHDRLERERKEYVADRQRKYLNWIANSWSRQATGLEASNQLKSGFTVDYVGTQSDLLSVRPLVHLDEKGEASLTTAGEVLCDMDIFCTDPLRLSLRRKPEMTNEEFSQIIAKVYAYDPDMQRQLEVAKSMEAAANQLGAENRSARIGELSEDNPIDMVLLEKISSLSKKDLFDSGLGLEGGLLYAEYRDVDDNDESLFLHTESARKLLETFQASGVQLAPEAEEEIISEHDERYGNFYAWMSREIVRMAADKDSLLLTEESLADLCESEKAIPETGNVPADVIIGLLNQIAQRGDDRHCDLPLPKDRVQLRDGGCKDVEEYFAQARAINATWIEEVKSNDGRALRLLGKRHGSMTMLGLDSVYYCGVEFPPGTVWAMRGDGYVPLRLTGFCFDAKIATEVFGKDSVYKTDPESAEQTHQMIVAL